MFAGRSCMLVFFPVLGTLLALALSIIVILGSSPNAPGLQTLYFMRLDFTNLTTNGIATLSDQNSPGQVGNTIRSEVTQKLGIADFYDIGAAGYCEGNYKGGVTDITRCSTPMTPFWFDITSVMTSEIHKGYQLKLPDEVQNYQNVLKASSQAMWICYVSAIVVMGVGQLIAFWAFRSRMASCCTTIFSFAGFVLIFLATGIGTGVFSTYSRYFNNDAGQYGIHASMDPKVYVCSWVATAAALWAFVWWMFSICCAPAAVVPPYPEFEEKQPFIGYVPRRRYFY